MNKIILIYIYLIFSFVFAESQCRETYNIQEFPFIDCDAWIIADPSMTCEDIEKNYGYICYGCSNCESNWNSIYGCMDDGKQSFSQYAPKSACNYNADVERNYLEICEYPSSNCCSCNELGEDEYCIGNSLDDYCGDCESILSAVNNNYIPMKIDECGDCGGDGPELGYTCNEIPDMFSFNESNTKTNYIIPEVYSNEGYILDSTDWLAVFNEDVCVGSVKWDVANCSNGVCSISAMGYDPLGIEIGHSFAGYMLEGQIPTFKIYDSSKDLYYDVVPYNPEDINLEFVNNISAPIDFPKLIPEYSEFNIPLYYPANLISFYVLPNISDISEFLPNINNNIVAIIGPDIQSALYTDAYSESFQWLGSLTSFDQNSSYWFTVKEPDGVCENLFDINMDNDCDQGNSCQCVGGANDGSSCIDNYDCPSEIISDIGFNLDKNRLYDLKAGTNWISFPYPGTFDLISSIPIQHQNKIVKIIGAGGAVIYDSNTSSFIGSLTSFSGLKGYSIYLTEDISNFMFEINVTLNRKNKNKNSLNPEGFNVSQSSKQAFYFIEDVTLDKGAIELGDYLLSYNGSILTGTREWKGTMIDVPAMGMDGSVGTIGYHEKGTQPTFKLLKKLTGKIITLRSENMMSWENNGVFVIKSLKEAGSNSSNTMLLEPFPNPFNPITNLDFKLNTSNDVNLTIFNVQGRLVKTLVDNYIEEGVHSISWNAEGYPSGVYFVKLIVGQSVDIKKLVLLK